MRYFWTLLAGMLVGAVAGVLSLYLNPLTASGPAGAADELDRVLRYALPDDALVLAHGGHAGLPLRPPGVDELWEETVRASVLGSLVLDGPDGQPDAVASRVVVPSKRTDLLSRGVLVDDYWLVTVPGDGSLLVVAETNLWPVLKDVLPVAWLDRPFRGPLEYRPTAGPSSLGSARVVGATGRFAGQSGRARERYRLEGFSARDGLERVAAELRLRLDEPPDADEPPGADEPPDGDTPAENAPPAADTPAETAPPAADALRETGPADGDSPPDDDTP